MVPKLAVEKKLIMYFDGISYKNENMLLHHENIQSWIKIV